MRHKPGPYSSPESRAPSAEEKRIRELMEVLQAMLDSYYRLTDQLPKKTVMHGLCVGAFGEVPEMAARVLRV